MREKSGKIKPKDKKEGQRDDRIRIITPLL